MKEGHVEVLSLSASAHMSKIALPSLAPQPSVMPQDLTP